MVQMYNPRSYFWVIMALLIILFAQASKTIQPSDLRAIKAAIATPVAFTR